MATANQTTTVKAAVVAVLNKHFVSKLAASWLSGVADEITQAAISAYENNASTSPVGN
jgi:hypothetical protein